MKRMRATWLAGLVLCGIGLNAGAGEREMLQQVADDAGVSINEVRMVLGSRTQFPQYRTSYDRIEPRVRASLARVQAQRAAMVPVQSDKPSSGDTVAIAEETEK
ncbi:hypothetical protein [Lysobacter niastensis]|uniref:DUF4148 domain-containing protein n=1 Tax=Lysobacter niastensis TaxID=380629 RepID=A0ABS0B8C6_9GAMM|nr:hypothetical protein [Lysobacter niastensis]MBF6024468.1 hypothetical protein [Lysobacter niastensis]